MKSLQFTVVVTALSVSACDPIYGIATTATLKSPVNVECIDSAIRETAGVGVVHRGYDEDTSYEIAPTPGNVTTRNSYWTYGDDGSAILQITQNNRSVEYSNGRQRMGVKIPPSAIEAYIPLMRRVNAKVESRCGLRLGNSVTVDRS